MYSISSIYFMILSKKVWEVTKKKIFHSVRILIRSEFSNKLFTRSNKRINDQILNIRNMSLTLEKVIINATRLAKRLENEDEIADTLLSETNQIHQKIEAMKQFQEEVEHLNDIANQKPHSQLIANIQKENRHLKEIQQENRELRATLEEYQTTLEHIMFKYRQHTMGKIYNTRINFKNLQNIEYDNIIKIQAEKIQEMAAVMQKAANLGEEETNAEDVMISQLTAENKGLREILGISQRYGSTKQSTEDKIIQTDPAT
ncbi:hypothetical protein HHI36_009464 [Cryptolaemus montrouzieri]|uniref:Uncharacterized protein n=1 Tax=Cryptolaemus montrouzieri TaxID=559131 RepID=A0ABD2MFP6_9CUCU